MAEEVKQAEKGEIKEIRIVYEKGEDVFSGNISIGTRNFTPNNGAAAATAADDGDADVNTKHEEAEAERQRLEAVEKQVIINEATQVSTSAQEQGIKKVTLGNNNNNGAAAANGADAAADPDGTGGGSKRGGKKSRKPKSKRIRVRKTRRRKH